jgi:hypothetical protein
MFLADTDAAGLGTTLEEPWLSWHQVAVLSGREKIKDGRSWVVVPIKKHREGGHIDPKKPQSWGAIKLL